MEFGQFRCDRPNFNSMNCASGPQDRMLALSLHQTMRMQRFEDMPNYLYGMQIDTEIKTPYKVTEEIEAPSIMGGQPSNSPRLSMSKPFTENFKLKKDDTGDKTSICDITENFEDAQYEEGLTSKPNTSFRNEKQSEAYEPSINNIEIDIPQYVPRKKLTKQQMKKLKKHQ